MATPPPPHPAPGAQRVADEVSCPNCDSVVVRRYCADCGQERPGPGDYSLPAHLSDLTDAIASRDGTAVRTLRTLVARPGALTAEHLAGRRARYLRPIQLFLVINVLLFLAAPQVPFFSYRLENYVRYAPPSPALVSALVQRATSGKGGDREAYERAFDTVVEAQRKSLVILFAPAVALVLRLLFAWRPARPGVPKRYGEHLVFALHGLSFLWLAFAAVGICGSAAGLLLRLVAGGPLAPAAPVVLLPIVALILSIPLHLFLSVRRAYALSPLRALAATAALAVAFAALLLAYRTLLFFTTYLAL